MFDTHEKIAYLAPSLFGISYYSIFVSLGILAGILYYLMDAKQRNVNKEGTITIVSAGLIFGFIGAKIPLLFENHDIMVLLTGKSIVGGLLGGMLGVVCVKKAFKIKLKLGNIIAPSVALGMAIGRIGCFLNGCCFGIASSWGFDFGDGQLRLPTQLFEVAFHTIAFVILNYYKDKVATKGILFKIYVLIYFIFRFLIEFIRENPKIWLDMSIYQIICVLGALFMAVKIKESVYHG